MYNPGGLLYNGLLVYFKYQILMETTTDNILDVTKLEPRKKHPTIFAMYHDLSEGDSLIIHNDHDPKPLYYQFLGELGNVFEWEYLEEGPVWWKVKIRKRKAGEIDETLGQMAAKDLRKAEIFKKYGLDFSCGGKKTVKEAASEKGLDVTKIEQELQQVDKKQDKHSIPYDEWSASFLADYIVNTHHLYIRKNLPDITAYAKKVLEVHGAQHPELKEINEITQSLAERLMKHIDEEEKQVFPKMKEELAKKSGHGAFAVKPSFDGLEREHKEILDDFAKIKELTKQYTLPSDACASYELLFRNLEALQDDLFLHFHLENNILFINAIKDQTQAV